MVFACQYSLFVNNIQDNLKTCMDPDGDRRLHEAASLGQDFATSMCYRLKELAIDRGDEFEQTITFQTLKDGMQMRRFAIQSSGLNIRDWRTQDQ